MIDAFGAALSTVLQGVVLVTWEEYVGMPAKVLYLLAGLACLFAMYSFSRYLLVANITKNHVQVIAFANLACCCLTVVLSVYLFQQLTTLGVLYFAGEILLILLLVIVELKTAAGLCKK